MFPKLLTNCAEDKLLTNCAGTHLLSSASEMKIVYEWIANPVWIPGYWTWTRAGGWSVTPDYWIVVGSVVNPKYLGSPVDYYTGGWDLFTETTFLGRSLGWYANGRVAPYMLFEDFSANPAGGSGHEDITIRIDEAHVDGAWNTSTTIYLEANWYLSAGTSLVVTVTYNCVTQSKIISPDSITTISQFSLGPSQIVTPVGYITVNADGTFSLH